jgi:hypothetical protein
MMARSGRKPQGVGLVTPLLGSKHAKQRMTWFLQTLTGECSVGEACAALGICESRFYDQRSEWLQASLAVLEPRSPGRPPKPEPMVLPEEVQALRRRLGELETRAAAAEVQAELARTLPYMIGRVRAGKKTTVGNKRRANHVSPRAGRKLPKCR